MLVVAFGTLTAYAVVPASKAGLRVPVLTVKALRLALSLSLLDVSVAVLEQPINNMATVTASRSPKIFFCILPSFCELLLCTR
jgi:hypothetical protein